MVDESLKFIFRKMAGREGDGVRRSGRVTRSSTKRKLEATRSKSKRKVSLIELKSELKRSNV